MNSVDLKDLKALIEKVTPGPWYAGCTNYDNVFKSCVFGANKDDIIVETTDDRGYDMQFIAAARQDIPKLIKIIEDLLGSSSVGRAPGC